MKKLENTGTNAALIFGGSLIGVIALSLVVAKKAKIDPIFAAIVAPILAIPIGTALMQNLIKDDSTKA